MIRKYFFVFFFVSSVLFSSTANADQLLEYLMKQSDPQFFDIETLHDEYAGYVRSGDTYVPLDKAGVEALMKEQKDMGVELTISNHRILSQSGSEHFTSVTYEYSWVGGVGNTQMSGVVTGHSILEKTAEGWLTLYDAVTQ